MLRQNSVRCLLLASVSVLAIGGLTPATAADAPVRPAVKAPAPVLIGRTISGTLELYGGHSWLGGNEISASSSEAEKQWLLGGRGKVDVPFGEGDRYSVQFDLDAETAFHKPQDDSATDINNTYAGNVIAAVHLNYREMNRYLFGVFAGGGKVFVDDSSDTGISTKAFFAGVEAQGHFGNNTLYGQLGYLGANQPDESLGKAWFVRGVARHFYNQGTGMIQGELSYAKGKYVFRNSGSSDDPLKILGWGVRVEQQIKTFAGNNGYVSAFLDYQGGIWKNTGDCCNDKVKDHTVLFGLKFAMNQGTLQANNLNGATVDLPPIGRWVGRAPGAD